MDLTTSVATIAQLLAAFTGERSRADQLKSETIGEFLEWLRRENHKELVTLIESNHSVTQSIEKLLGGNHTQLMREVTQLNEKMAEFVTQSESLAGIADALGVKPKSSFDQEQFDIRSVWQSKSGIPSEAPVFRLMLHPLRYDLERWPTEADLIGVIKRTGFRSNGRAFPCDTLDAALMQFGVYGRRSSPSWAFTHSGLFWAAFILHGYKDYIMDDRDKSLRGWGWNDKEHRIAKHDFIDFYISRAEIANAFCFASRLVGELEPDGQIHLDAIVSPLQGKYLGSLNEMHPMELSDQALSPVCNLTFNGTAEGFQQKWRAECVRFQCKFYGMFDHFGFDLTARDLDAMLNRQFPPQ